MYIPPPKDYRYIYKVNVLRGIADYDESLFIIHDFKVYCIEYGYCGPNLGLMLFPIVTVFRNGLRF